MNQHCQHILETYNKHKITRLKQVHRRNLEEVAARLGPEFMNNNMTVYEFYNIRKAFSNSEQAYKQDTKCIQ